MIPLRDLGYSRLRNRKNGGCQSLGVGGMRCYCLMGIEFQFCKMMIRFLEIDGGDCCTTRMYLIPLNYKKLKIC